jgi:PAS domain S-box-containing protein
MLWMFLWIFAQAPLAQAQDGAASPEPPGPARPALTTLKEVISFNMDTARRVTQPARIRGVITMVARGWPSWIYVQDATAGALVVYRSASGELAEGTEVEAEGFVDVGDFHTYVGRATVRVVGTKPLPQPTLVVPDRLPTRDDFGQWVRIRARVRNVATYEHGAVFLLAWGPRHFLMFLYEPGVALPGNLLDSLVEIDGLNWSDYDSANRPLRFRLHCHTNTNIRVVSPGRSDPFDMPLASAAELRAPTTPESPRIRIRGTVLGTDPALSMVFVETEHGLAKLQVLPSFSRRNMLHPTIREHPSFHEFRPLPEARPEPGEIIDAIGVPTDESPFTVRLVSADWRVVHRGEPPVPLQIHPEDGRKPANDGRLVRIRARFIDHTFSTVGPTNVVQLWLQADKEIFEARFEGSDTNSLVLPEGSLVEASGICLPILGELRKPRGMRLLLRSPSDVQPADEDLAWITPRVVKILSLAAAVAAAGLIWIGMLHRQVQRQTTEIQAGANRLQLSEQRFRTVFRSSPAVMSLTRLDNSQFIAVNDAFLKATGYSESEVIGRFAQDLNLYADPEQRLEFIEILRRDGMARDREHLVRRKDGSTFTALITGDIIDIDGRPHTLTVALDITARKKAEQDTLRALDAERELGELKSRFVSLVSHEFRTPLGITMSAVELLRNYLDRLPAAKRAELLDDIYSATLRMSDLMEQVLLLGRVEAGKVLFKPVPIDLVSFAGRIIDETLSATHHRCPVTVTGTRDAAEAIADEALLRPILSNLLTNAIKYSDEGHPVRVGISRTGDEAVFTVTDQGIGIPEADHPRLFEAFHRASNVEHVSGTGLGLLIVRRCVDLHQGRIDFESRLGEGTTFRVHIPAYPISLT